MFESRRRACPVAYGLHVHQIWLTAIGRDRPGIVAGVANVLLAHGLNIEDSHMRILGGRFSMMLVVRGDAQEERLYRDLLAAGRELGLDYIYVHPIADADTTAPVPTHAVVFTGIDKPGQVAAVADTVAGVGANITDLSTKIEGPTSELHLELDVPEGVAIEEVLQKVAAERGIDVTVGAL